MPSYSAGYSRLRSVFCTRAAPLRRRNWQLVRRRGQAGRNLLRVLDGQYDFVVFAVGHVEDNPGVVAMADGESDARGVMKASYPDAGKLCACPLQAVDLGYAVRYGPHAADRAAGECLNSVRRLEPLPARYIDRYSVIGNQQVRHEMTFWLAPVTGCQWWRERDSFVPDFCCYDAMPLSLS